MTEPRELPAERELRDINLNAEAATILQHGTVNYKRITGPFNRQTVVRTLLEEVGEGDLVCVAMNYRMAADLSLACDKDTPPFTSDFRVEVFWKGGIYNTDVKCPFIAVRDTSKMLDGHIYAYTSQAVVKVFYFTLYNGAPQPAMPANETNNEIPF